MNFSIIRAFALIDGVPCFMTMWVNQMFSFACQADRIENYCKNLQNKLPDCPVYIDEGHGILIQY